MLLQMSRSFRGLPTPRGRAVLIALAALLLCGIGLIPSATGKVAAQDYEYPQSFIRDVPVPLPHQVGPNVYLTIPGLSTTPPPDPQIGDSWIWWLWSHETMPPDFVQRSCTIRGKTDRGYVVVEDSEWLVSIDQADVDIILERWENSSIGPYPTQGIYEIDSLSFGEPPDELDNDPRVYLMWFDFGISADGFFFWFDEYLDGLYLPYRSNECEVLYLNPYSQGGPSGDYMLSVIAHEFEHQIHWKYDDNEETWVDEGLAELAMWFYGRPDVISSFNSSPDNNLTVWEGYWADYIQTYLWSLYFFERYGGHPAIHAVVHEPANSIAGYDSVLNDFGYSEDFTDVFADWAVANFLDDTSLVDGRFGYIGSDLPPFRVSGSYSSYPVTNILRTVNYWAADYYRFTNFDGFENLQLSFDGADDNNFAVWGLALYGGTDSTDVLRMTLNETSQTGTLYVTGLTDPDDEVILTVASISSTGANSYYFSANDSQGIAHNTFNVAAPALWIQAVPNPFTTTVALRLNWSGDFTFGDTDIQIFDSQGRLVNRLNAAATSENEATLVWNGQLANGYPASPGVYYARAEVGSACSVVKILYLP